MSDLFAKYVLARLLSIGWFSVLAPPALLYVWLRHGLQDKLPDPKWIAAPWALVSLIASWWLGKTMARYMVDENKRFFQAIKWTLCEFRFQLVFLPVIGPLFTPDEDKTHHDDDPTCDSSQPPQLPLGD